MPVSELVVTPGASNANAYVTLEVANQYHFDRPPTGFWNIGEDDGAQSVLKTQAILYATKLMDSQVEWAGSRTSTSQALQWPRSGVYDRSGYLMPSNTIPVLLQHATAEFARELIARSFGVANSELEKMATTAKRLDMVSITTDAASVTFRDPPLGLDIPASVFQLFPPDWVGGVRGVRHLIRA